MHDRKNIGLWVMYWGYVLFVLACAALVAAERRGWARFGGAPAVNHRSP